MYSLSKKCKNTTRYVVSKNFVSIRSLTVPDETSERGLIVLIREHKINKIDTLTVAR